MKYTVELSERAEADVREAYAYIAAHGPADPDDWKSELDQKLTSLEIFPEASGLAPENDHVQETLRQSFHGPFRIIFTVRGQNVYVITVRHGARRFLRPDDIELP